MIYLNLKQAQKVKKNRDTEKRPILLSATTTALFWLVNFTAFAFARYARVTGLGLWGWLVETILDRVSAMTVCWC